MEGRLLGGDAQGRIIKAQQETIKCQQDVISGTGIWLTAKAKGMGKGQQAQTPESWAYQTVLKISHLDVMMMTFKVSINFLIRFLGSKPNIIFQVLMALTNYFNNELQNNIYIHRQYYNH